MEDALYSRNASYNLWVDVKPWVVKVIFFIGSIHQGLRLVRRPISLPPVF